MNVSENIKDNLKDVFRRTIMINFYLIVSFKYLLYVAELYDQSKATFYNGVLPGFIFIIFGPTPIINAMAKAYPGNKKFDKWFLIEIIFGIILHTIFVLLFSKYLPYLGTP